MFSHNRKEQRIPLEAHLWFYLAFGGHCGCVVAEAAVLRSSMWDPLVGMEVLNRAIESIMNTSDSNDWEPIVIHISDSVLSLWKGEVRRRNQETCKHW